MRRLRTACRPALMCLAALVWLSQSATQVQAQGLERAESIEELLAARWFEIELIVFERLDVLDTNTSEALTQRAPRAWPHNLLELGSLLPDDIDLSPAQLPEPAPDAIDAAGDEALEAGEETVNPLTLPSRFCLGYPALPFEDPLHPALAAHLQPEPPLDDLDGNDKSEPPDLAEESSVASEEAAAGPPPAETAAGLAGVEDAQNGAAGAELDQPPALNAPPLELSPYLQLLADAARFEAQLQATSFRWLETTTMTNEVKAINRRNSLRPLLHGRWRQPVPERDDPQPVYLSAAIEPASPATAAGFAKLEGYVEVTVGRYLHFAPRLWYHADTIGLAPIALPVQGALPSPDPLAHMELRESRRMRSGDLHYLDHPKIGVIVRIDPVEIPETLTAALAALAETDDEAL